MGGAGCAYCAFQNWVEMGVYGRVTALTLGIALAAGIYVVGLFAFGVRARNLLVRPD